VNQPQQQHHYLPVQVSVSLSVRLCLSRCVSLSDVSKDWTCKDKDKDQAYKDKD